MVVDLSKLSPDATIVAHKTSEYLILQSESYTYVIKNNRVVKRLATTSLKYLNDIAYLIKGNKIFIYDLFGNQIEVLNDYKQSYTTVNNNLAIQLRNEIKLVDTKTKTITNICSFNTTAINFVSVPDNTDKVLYVSVVNNEQKQISYYFLGPNIEEFTLYYLNGSFVKIEAYSSSYDLTTVTNSYLISVDRTNGTKIKYYYYTFTTQK